MPRSSMLKVDKARFREALGRIQQAEGGESLRWISKQVGYEASYLSVVLSKGLISGQCLTLLENRFGLSRDDVLLDRSPRQMRMDGTEREGLAEVIRKAGKEICDRLDTLIGLCQGDTVRQLMEEAVAAGSARAAEQERERKRNLMRSGAD